MDLIKHFSWGASAGRKYYELGLPALASLLAVYFFYKWVVDGRFLFLGGFIIAILFLIIVFTLGYSAAPKIAKRVTSYIIGGFGLTLLVSGYFFQSLNQTTIKEADLKSNLKMIQHCNDVIDGFFSERITAAQLMTRRLNIMDLKNYPSIIGEFYNSRSDDYISIYLLNPTGISQFGYPRNYDYLETNKLTSIVKPTVTDPSFTVSLSQNSAELTSAKLIVPFYAPDSLNYYLLFNLRMEKFNSSVKEASAGFKAYLIQNGEVVFSSSGDNSDRDFKSFKETGFFENTEQKKFITRSNLRSLTWQSVTVQTFDQAFPDVVIAESDLTKVVLLWGFLGIVTSLVLSAYLSRSILSPMSKLNVEAASIARGDMDILIEEPASTADEIVELSHSVKTLLRQLKEKVNALNVANDKLSETQHELDSQLTAAHKIQMGLIPSNSLLTSGYDVFGKLILAHDVGGDYFDYFEMDENHLGIILIDAAGKGISASFYAALVKGVTEFHLKSKSISKDNIKKYFYAMENQLFAARDHRTRTVAMQFAILNTHTGHLTVVNAGLENPILMRNRSVFTLDVKGRAMGMPRWLGDFGEAELTLNENDSLLFHTDGIENIEEKILTHKINQNDWTASSSKDIVSAINKSCMNGSRIYDDLGLVLLKRHAVQKQFSKIESTPDSEAPLIEEIGKRMTKLHFSESKVNDFKIALREALINAVKHGNQYNASHTVDLVIYSANKFVEVKIHDYGKGFEASSLEKPSIKKKLRGEQRSGGWGFHVIQKLVSDWSIHHDENGTTLSLRMIEEANS